MSEFKITFLGTRGSVPASGKEYNIYGGRTTCLLIEADEQAIIIDGGTGLLNAEQFLKPETKKISILLTHAHIDHILGLVSFPPLFSGKYEINIMGFPLSGLSAREQLYMLMKQPLWPISPDIYNSSVKFHSLNSSSFDFGKVHIESEKGSHPGNAVIYKVSYENKCFVFCTDFEHIDAPAVERLIAFASGCSLLIYDGQYTDDEYLAKKGWGHSTWQTGARIAENCGAKKLILTHHDPFRTDEEIAVFEKELKNINPEYSFSKSNEVVML